MSRGHNPYKVWRCGNFVIRRRAVPTLGDDEWALSDEQVRFRVLKGDIGTVDVIEISSLDGAWGVRLMPGTEIETIMGSMLDDDKKDIDDEWVRLICTNLITASTIPNGHYHMALMFVAAVYSDPSLISGSPFSKKRRSFSRDVKKLRDAFVAWRKDFDAFVASQPDDDGRQEVLRGEAEAVLRRGAPRDLSQE